MKNYYKNIHSYFGIKNNNRPVVIAEVGNNHNGSIKLAKRLIKTAKTIGIDVVKFQTETYDGLWVDKWLDKNLNVGPYVGKRREFHEKTLFYPDQTRELFRYANEISMPIFSTATCYESTNLLDDLGVPLFKIASMDIVNHLLLKHVAKKNKPMILSTAMATTDEIDSAIDLIYSCGNSKIALMQCTGIYPTPNKDANLNVIKTFKNKYKFPIGFSDHTIGYESSMCATLFGAELIEKHFTLDKTLEGPDHYMCADPDEFSLLLKKINISIQLGGNNIKLVLPDEKKYRKLTRRSLVASRDIKKNEYLDESMLLAKRPGHGITPDKLSTVIGKMTKHSIRKDSILRNSSLRDCE